MKNIALWLGILVVVMMGVYPPWRMKLDRTGFARYSKAIGYHPLFKPPVTVEPDIATSNGIFADLLAKDKLSRDRLSPYTFSIDFSRLGIQWGLVALVTAGLMYSLPGRKEARKASRGSTKTDT